MKTPVDRPTRSDSGTTEPILPQGDRTSPTAALDVRQCRNDRQGEGKHRSSRKQHGFTLLEIMVVLALVAISVTFVVLNLQRDTDGVAQLEARRFAGLIEQARSESILSGRPYAVKVDTNHKTYTFLEHGKQWSAVEGDDVFRPRSFPQDLRVSFETTGSPGAGDLLVIEGLGDITPFVLTIRGASRQYKVTIDEGQNVIVSSAPNET